MDLLDSGAIIASNKCHLNVGVSKNRGTQKGWFLMENPIKMGWFGGTTIFGTPHVKNLLVFVSSSGTSLCKKTPTDRVKSNKSLEICSVNELW